MIGQGAQTGADTINGMVRPIVGALRTSTPIKSSSQHHCSGSGQYFDTDTSDVALTLESRLPTGRGHRPLFGRGGWVAVSGRLMAPLARPLGLRSIRHHPELGRGQ